MNNHENSGIWQNELRQLFLVTAINGTGKGVIVWIPLTGDCPCCGGLANITKGFMRNKTKICNIEDLGDELQKQLKLKGLI